MGFEKLREDAACVLSAGTIYVLGNSYTIQQLRPHTKELTEKAVLLGRRLGKHSAPIDGAEAALAQENVHEAEGADRLIAIRRERIARVSV